MNDLTIVGLEWLGGVTVFLVFILLLRYLEHRERMSMIERGLLHPEAKQHPSYPRGSAQLRGGLITAGVGFALTVGLYNLGWLLPAPLTAAPGRLGPWLLPGLIPLAIGLALVAGYYLSPPHQESETTSSNNSGRDRAEDNLVGDASKRRSGWYLVEPGTQDQDDNSIGFPEDTTPGTGTTDAPSAT
jgi:hypothetical protein